MGMMRLLSRSASSTSQAQISERAELGERTKTTVSASLIRFPSRRFQSSPPEMPCRSMTHSKPYISKRCVELVGELQVVAAVGNKDAKLPFVGQSPLVRLLRTSGIRRS